MNKIARFLKRGVKTLRREKFFAAVNIFGLSLGMFCFLVTSLYVRDELTHDQWHENVSRIYTPKLKIPAGGGQSFYTFPPHPFGAALEEASPEVEAVVAISRSHVSDFKTKEEWFKTSKLFYTQNSLFRVFDFSLRLGDQATAFTEPNTAVISSELARKHFPGQNPLGEILEFKKEGTYKIVGVLDEIPGNSHLHFDVLLPYDYTKGPYKDQDTEWKYSGEIFYILAKEGATEEAIVAGAQAVSQIHEDKERSELYEVQKFESAYLDGLTFRNYSSDLFGGQTKYIYIFTAVGLLILLVACFNYINLTTARSFSRSRDMAIRKIVGASKSRLVLNGIGETLFLTVISGVIALIALELALPTINEMMTKRLDLNFLAQPELILIPATLMLLVVAISGIYPALIASSFNLAALLKGNSPKSKSAFFRKVLVVFQFLICAGLLSTGLIIRGQANYLINLDMGYNARNIINLPVMQGGFSEKYEELKAELERVPQIEMISASSMPRIQSLMILPIAMEGEEEKKEELMYYTSADKGLVDLFGFELIAGRKMEDLLDTELEKAVLINEAASKKFNWDDPIGKELTPSFKVQGVIKDFHFSSGKNEIEPMMIRYASDDAANMHLRFREGDREAVLAQAKEIWESFNTNEPFSHENVEGYYLNSYSKEQVLVQIFDMLTGLLVFISFLGLFALSTLENKLREKEMSIRKVLGAGYLSLIAVMNQRFLFLVVLALVISVPLTWYFIDAWLSDFPYRIPSTTMQFIASTMGVLVLAVAVLTVHGYRNAKRNPADILRNE